MPDTPATASDSFAGSRTIGGYTFSRWRLAEFADFEIWIKLRRVRDALRHLAEVRDLTPEQRSRIAADIGDEPVGLDTMLREIRSRRALYYALKLSLRQHHGEPSDEAVGKIEFEAGGMVGLLRWIVGIDVLPEPEPGEAPPDPPARTAASPSSSDSPGS